MKMIWHYYIADDSESIFKAVEGKFLKDGNRAEGIGKQGGTSMCIRCNEVNGPKGIEFREMFEHGPSLQEKATSKSLWASDPNGVQLAGNTLTAEEAPPLTFFASATSPS
jgi:hypothetical protein